MRKNDFQKYSVGREGKKYFDACRDFKSTNYDINTSQSKRIYIQKYDKRNFFNTNSNCDRSCCAAVNNFFCGACCGCCMYDYGGCEEVPISACHDKKKNRISSCDDVLQLKTFQRKLFLHSEDENTDNENSQDNNFKTRISSAMRKSNDRKSKDEVDTSKTEKNVEEKPEVEPKSSKVEDDLNKTKAAMLISKVEQKKDSKTKNNKSKEKSKSSKKETKSSETEIKSSKTKTKSPKTETKSAKSETKSPKTKKKNTKTETKSAKSETKKNDKDKKSVKPRVSEAQSKAQKPKSKIKVNKEVKKKSLVKGSRDQFRRTRTDVKRSKNDATAIKAAQTKNVEIIHSIGAGILSKMNDKYTSGRYNTVLRNSKARKIPYELIETDDEKFEKNYDRSKDVTKCYNVFVTKESESEIFKPTSKFKELNGTKKVMRKKWLDVNFGRTRSVENIIERKTRNTETPKSRERTFSQKRNVLKKSVTYSPSLQTDSDVFSEIGFVNKATALKNLSVDNEVISSTIIENASSETILPKMLLVYQNEADKTKKTKYYPILEIPLNKKNLSYLKLNLLTKNDKNKKEKVYKMKRKSVKSPKEDLRQESSQSQSTLVDFSFEREGYETLQDDVAEESSETDNDNNWTKNNKRARLDTSEESSEYITYKIPTIKRSTYENKRFDRGYDFDEVSTDNSPPYGEFSSKNSGVVRSKCWDQVNDGMQDRDRYDIGKEKRFLETFYSLHDKIIQKRLNNLKKITNSPSPPLTFDLSKCKYADRVKKTCDDGKGYSMGQKTDDYLEDKNKVLEHINSLYRRKKNLEQEYKNSEKNFENFVSDNIAVLFPKAALKFRANV